MFILFRAIFSFLLVWRSCGGGRRVVVVSSARGGVHGGRGGGHPRVIVVVLLGVSDAVCLSSPFCILCVVSSISAAAAAVNRKVGKSSFLFSYCRTGQE